LGDLLDAEQVIDRRRDVDRGVGPLSAQSLAHTFFEKVDAGLADRVARAV
jgi:hypothetical protein